MGLGDLGGAITELFVTCKTTEKGRVHIQKGDAVKLCGNFVVTNNMDDGDLVFGQAFASCETNDTYIPVKVKGVCRFEYVGNNPVISRGIVGSRVQGMVDTRPPMFPRGINLAVDEEKWMVEVLL